MGGQGVVEGHGDAAQGARAALHHAADVSLKGQVPPFMFHHLHPVHPLQGKTQNYGLLGFCGQQSTGKGSPVMRNTRALDPQRIFEGFPLLGARSGSHQVSLRVTVWGRSIHQEMFSYQSQNCRIRETGIHPSWGKTGTSSEGDAQSRQGRIC